jgi:hypothetical protein
MRPRWRPIAATAKTAGMSRRAVARGRPACPGLGGARGDCQGWLAPGAKGRQRHGLTAARRFLAAFGARAIDALTSVGRALAEWRRD